jgi:hypothetical protein
MEKFIESWDYPGGEENEIVADSCGRNQNAVRRAIGLTRSKSTRTSISKRTVNATLLW